MTTWILDGIWGWHTRWEKLRQKLEQTIGPCHIWHYNNSGHSSLETEGAAFLKALEEDPGPRNVIGYSMGGLVAREAIRQNPALAIRKAVFLHSPHNGSLAAHGLSLAACREMRPGSPFLKRLDAAPWPIPTLVTWCPWDGVVIPGSSACWSRASVVIKSQVPAHAWPIISPAIHSSIVRFLKAA
jgi:hypothetical protein